MKLISKDGFGIFEKGNSVYFSTGNNFYEYDFKKTNEVSKKEYLSCKYGNKNKYWDKPFHEFGRLKNGNFVTVFYQENNFRVHSPEGKIIRTIEKIRPRLNCGGIYGMTVDKDENIWIVAPTEHYLGKFNLQGTELFSIAGDDSLEPGELDYPEHISSKGEFVFISDMGNRRIVKMNITNYEMDNYKLVDESIYYFNQLNGKNIYQLSSGIYIE